MTESFKTSDGCSIAYHVHKSSGANPVRVVLIHSLALNGSIWSRVVPFLTPAADVLIYDCRGHGHSGRQAGHFTPELFARDLAELLEHLDWNAAVVGGCSMGGCVAQAFAGLYPSRISALALIDTTAWYGEGAPSTWRERAAAASAKGLSGMAEFQVTRWFGETFRKEHPELVRQIMDVFTANELNCYASSCAMLGDADLRPYLSGLRMPVAVIVGEEDYATPIHFSQELHKAIPDSTLMVIPGGRHLTPFECPAEIASQLLTLVQRIPPAETRK